MIFPFFPIPRNLTDQMSKVVFIALAILVLVSTALGAAQPARLEALKEILADSCPYGYYLDPRVHKCVPLSNASKSCPDGYYLDPRTQKCVPLSNDLGLSCPEGYYLDPRTRNCVPLSNPCPKGYYLEPHTRRCVPFN